MKQGTQVKKVMTKNLKTISTKATIHEAAKLLAENDIGMLPVLSDDKKPVGTLTDRDIVVRGLARGVDMSKADVERVMSPDVISCEAETSLKDASELMQKRKVRRLVVTDQDSVVGILSVGDLARESGNANLVAGTLESICR